MPTPWRTDRVRSAGPTPFTTEWINEPPEPPRPRRFGGGAIPLPTSVPSWLPSERLLTALLVLALVCSTAVAAGGNDAPVRTAASSSESATDDRSLAVGGATDDPAPSAEESAAPGVDASTTTDGAEDGTTGSTAPPTPTVAQSTASLKLEPPSSPPADGSLLPYYRVVTYYGQPHDTNMGILGEFSVEDDIAGLHAALEEQAAEYELADPTRPVKLAFEIIATVAQGSAMNDGSWLLSTDDPTIQQFVDYAAEHDMLVILDLQIGRRGVPGELDLVRHWLEYPHVHLALDPEFAMEDGQVPGVDIGQIDAADIRYAQQYLVDLSAELGLPPKILIVHQFHFGMIDNKDQVAPLPGVQLVIDSDGWGPPELKRETYSVMNTEQPIEYNGIKLFYRQDEPLMEPPDVLALDPIPDLIIYQ